MSTKLKLYQSPGSCSLAAHIALEEAGADYDLVRISLAKGEHLQPEYLAVNPKAKIPVLADGSWVLTENPAILRFIARRYPTAGLWPEDAAQDARATEWLAWLATTIHPAFAHVVRPARWATDEAAQKDVAAKAVETCRAHWTSVDKALGDGPWALGERYSVADSYLLVFWRFGAGKTLGFDMASLCPRWTAHTRRMIERPAVRRVYEQEELELPSL
jgi:glutathione S-transferase